jgi:primase-polymerase (primpol)-like protein
VVAAATSAPRRFDFGAIPGEMRETNAWLLSDPSKVPRSPLTGGTVNAAAAGVGWPFAVVLAALPPGWLPGFVLPGGLVCVDIDGCIRPDGSLSPPAARIVAALDSYTEVSRSGCGLHVFAWGTLPSNLPGGRGQIDGQSIEVYERGRYIAMTGDLWGRR